MTGAEPGSKTGSSVITGANYAEVVATETHRKLPRTKRELASLMLDAARQLPGGHKIKRIAIEAIRAHPSLARHSNWVWSFADHGPLPAKPTLVALYATGRTMMQTYYLADATGQPVEVPE